jgi:hypothetical protein
MKSSGLKLFMSVSVFLSILTLLSLSTAFSGEAGKTLNTFVLSDEAPGKLLSILEQAGYGNYNLYQALLQMQAEASPSVAGIITPAFLNALAICPAGSQIFTTKLNSFPTGGSLAISTDGSVQIVAVQANDYSKRASASTQSSSISGAGAEDVNFVHSGIQPSTADFNAPLMSWTAGETKYNVFAIASGFVPAPEAAPKPSKKSFFDEPRKKTSFR